MSEEATATQADDALLELAQRPPEPDYVLEADGFEPGPPPAVLAPGPSAIPPLHLAV